MQETRGWVAVDGHLHRTEDASVGALEAGASVGWGVFSTGAIVGARAALLARHVERLRRDAQSAQIPHVDDAQWSSWGDVLRRVIEANQIETGMFRLTLCARGEGRWHPDGAPRAIVAAQAASLEVGPAKVWLSPYSMDAHSPLRGVKSTSYAPWHIMALAARERGCDEALYCAGKMLCEGARSNLFWRRGNVVFTPDLKLGCLPGIARAQILRWLQTSSRWRVKEGRASIGHLMHAEEVWLSNSTLGPRSVVWVQDDEAMLWQSTGKNPACEEMQRLWQQMMWAPEASSST